nr:ATP-dependent (S)-NAD(P)H-hydrate dehydratase [Seculamonas ecuadoriensis]
MLRVIRTLVRSPASTPPHSIPSSASFSLRRATRLHSRVAPSIASHWSHSSRAAARNMSSSSLEISADARRLLDRVAHVVIPSLSAELHKGQAGKVALVGGSRMYTGAPFLASMASLKAGGDLSHVFTIAGGGVANAIRAFSAELIVHPCLPDSEQEPWISWSAERGIAHFESQLARLSALVVGPGLGRDDVTMACVQQLVAKARAAGMPVVLDGDALFMVSRDIAGTLAGVDEWVVLTPNVNEYKGLARAVAEADGAKFDENKLPSVQDLSKRLGCTIIRKGQSDEIASGSKSLPVDISGSNRRCGGQGDVLAGTLGTFLSWAKAAAERGDCDESPVAIACYGAAALTRLAAQRAFAQHKRAMTATSILDHIGDAFASVFPERV